MKKVRYRIELNGLVQGVGFRPFVYRLAGDHHLTGWVLNDVNGVRIEIEGYEDACEAFLLRLQQDPPPPSKIHTFHTMRIPLRNDTSFRILESSSSSDTPQVWVLPDLALCHECHKELFDPENRRYRYPFITCTHCGPRFTIIESLPYDRERTTMTDFEMCSYCRAEYENPLDRRFHAQPIACHHCGPQLIWFSSGDHKVSGEEALACAAQALKNGQIIAVKGLGGYHLMVDATHNEAVQELRRRKRRSWKPFAVMYPDVKTLERHVHISSEERALLTSYHSPILLCERTQAGWEEISPSVAPLSPYLGVFLPYTPLHALLMKELQKPLVATSANLTDEPIQYIDELAFKTLQPLCDGFLTHNRRIAHHADDSVLHVLYTPQKRFQSLRRARGYAPLPLIISHDLPPLLAVGGHMHNTIALSRKNEIIVSQLIGDLDTLESREIFEKTVEHYLTITGIEPIAIIHDLHPDYFTTQWALSQDIPTHAVQHHYAHMCACLCENQIQTDALALTWDGTGYGTDGTIWGGEFLFGNATSFTRVASLYPFKLPGGDQAVRQPWRVTLALLYECFGKHIPSWLPLYKKVPEKKIDVLLQLIEKDIACVHTSSMGRLFDGVSALLGLCFENTYQAQAPQMLEYTALKNRSSDPHPHPFRYELTQTSPILLDWRPMIEDIVKALHQHIPVPVIAHRFHMTLLKASQDIIMTIQPPCVCLTGGVFCNRILTEGFLEWGNRKNVRVYIHEEFPPSDDSIALGQIWAGCHRI